MSVWYPSDKQELESFIEKSFKQKVPFGRKEGDGGRVNIKPKKINGLIVPHAGYEYSGMIAGKAFSLLKGKKIDKAIVIGPSHYIPTNQALTTDKEFIKTPLGKIAIKEFPSLKMIDLSSEHSINNQIPFLQKLGIKEIIPIMIGQITDEQAKDIAKKISKIKAIYIFSTDLSHFLPYEEAVKKDRFSIKILENLDEDNFKFLDACGFFPLIVLKHLCKIKKTHPQLIEYKNSGDIIGDKTEVVGYSSFWF